MNQGNNPTETGVISHPGHPARRRAGWTPGPAILLGGGATWSLPAIDDALVPLLPRVLGPARRVARDLRRAGLPAPARRAGAEERLLHLISLMLHAQYQVPRRALSALILATEVSELVDLLGVLEEYLDDLLVFAARRLSTVGVGSRADVERN